jgi:predicted methyltransferase MtxX (methanogen marker protein 4)
VLYSSQDQPKLERVILTTLYLAGAKHTNKKLVEYARMLVICKHTHIANPSNLHAIYSPVGLNKSKSFSDSLRLVSHSFGSPRSSNIHIIDT